jgi:hypothetical protein
MAKWSAPWWIQWPLINAIAFPLLLLSYHWLVRGTFIGAWLNGKRTGKDASVNSEPLASRRNESPPSIPVEGGTPLS